MIEWVISAAAAVVAGAAIPLLRMLAKNFGIKLGNEFYNQLDSIIGDAVTSAEKSLKRKAPDLSKTEFDNQVVDSAVEYVDRHAPKLRKELGLGRNDIERMVEKWLT